MAKIKLMLDTRRSLADGTFPIKLSVFINNKGRAIISLGVSVLEKQWNGFEVISHPMKTRYNSALRYRFSKADDVLMAMEVSGEIHVSNQGSACRRDQRNLERGKQALFINRQCL